MESWWKAARQDEDTRRSGELLLLTPRRAPRAERDQVLGGLDQSQDPRRIVIEHEDIRVRACRVCR